MAERRMLWKSISRSKKVNLKVKSLEAKLLYTWTIPHLDRESLIEADPASLKAVVVPLVDEITTENIQGFIQEIVTAGLWELYLVDDTQYARDPANLGRQTVHPHEAISQILPKIKGLKPLSVTCNDNSQPCNDNSAERKKERILKKEKNVLTMSNPKTHSEQLKEAYFEGGDDEAPFGREE